jgi:hypothetical protein
MTIPAMPLLAAQCWQATQGVVVVVAVDSASSASGRSAGSALGEGVDLSAGEDGEGSEGLRRPALGVVVAATVAPADAEQLCDGGAGDVVGVGEAVEVGADRSRLIGGGLIGRTRRCITRPSLDRWFAVAA